MLENTRNEECAKRAVLGVLLAGVLLGIIPEDVAFESDFFYDILIGARLSA